MMSFWTPDKQNRTAPCGACWSAACWSCQGVVHATWLKTTLPTPRQQQHHQETIWLRVLQHQQTCQCLQRVTQQLAPHRPRQQMPQQRLSAEAVQVISTINKPVEEDLLVIIDLDVLSGAGAEAPSDATTSSGARRRLLQNALANPKTCTNANDCSLTNTEKNNARIFYKEFSGQGTAVTSISPLLVNLPESPATGTLLTQSELPNTVQLKIGISSQAQVAVTPEVQNGTANNTLGPLPATTLRLYTYNLPKSYVVAPGKQRSR